VPFQHGNRSIQACSRCTRERLLFLVQLFKYLNSSFLGIEKIPGHPASFVRTSFFSFDMHCGPGISQDNSASGLEKIGKSQLPSKLGAIPE
jgi:hypothetical protein